MCPRGITQTYTDEELLQYLKDFYKKNKKAPTVNDKFPCNIATFYNHFGSWNNALKLANIPINKVQNKIDYTDEELLGIVKSKAKELGRSPKSNEIEFPSFTVFRNRFGGWNNTLIKAELEPLQKRKDRSSEFKDCTKEEIISILYDWSIENKMAITSGNLGKNNLPSVSFVLNKLGAKNWSEVIKLLNLPKSILNTRRNRGSAKVKLTYLKSKEIKVKFMLNGTEIQDIIEALCLADIDNKKYHELKEKFIKRYKKYLASIENEN